MSLKENEATFERLLQPHLPAMYRLSCRLTASKVEADELFLDVLARLYSRRQELDGLEQAATWLARVVYQRFVDDPRRFARHRLRTDDEAPLAGNGIDSLGNTGDNLHDAVWREQVQTLSRALDMLNETQRVTLLLHDAEGYKLKEIEFITGASLDSIKTTLRHARARLREILPDEGAFL